MARACVFCGGTGRLSAEHVFPDWSQPYLTSPHGQGTHERKVLRADGSKTESAYLGDPATVTVKAVCERCNNGWMSTLEARAKPYLLSMIEGHTRTYYKAGRELLATWAVKTALVSGSRFTPSTPESLYREFYEAGRPSENTRVWLIATPRPYFTYVDYRPLKVSRQGVPVESENAYAALLAMAHLAFYVVGWSESEPDLDGLAPFETSMVPLWPIETRTMTFPPPGPRLDHEDLDALADAPFGKADRSTMAPP